MTDNNHPITPPQKLVEQWCHKWTIANGDFGPYLATQAARWGADQQLKLDIEQVNQAWQRGADHELEACCEWVSQWCGRWPDGTRPEEELRAARRPKLLSLKEQALAQVESFACSMETLGMDSDLIRRALEQLND